MSKPSDPNASNSPLPLVFGDRYVVEREIGRGGMATVFLARDRKHDRLVAVKVFNPDLAAAIGADRFLREIEIAAHLRHPHIVTLFDSGKSNSLFYYVMPYVEGESLRQRLLRGKLDVAEAVRYWRDTVDAIAHAHRHGVVHRDIKPENVLLEERHALLVDFGVGKAIGDAAKQQALTNIGVVVGTPTYMAPEQATGSPDADHRVDIYALGTLAYEMLSGKVPFAELTPAAQIAAKAMDRPEDIRRLRADMPENLAHIVNRCLEPLPEKRYQNADELLAALESISTPGTGTSAWRGLVATQRRKNTVLAASALGVTLLAGATYAGVTRGNERQWARETAIPEIRRLADAFITDSAFVLAQRARAVLSDPELDALWDRVSVDGDFNSEPAGALVSWTGFRGDTSVWHPLGTTPMTKVRVPRGGQVTYILKFERPGFRTALRPMASERNAKQPALLDSAVAKDSGMVHVRGGVVVIPSPTRVAGDSVHMPDFLIDRYEVTNAEYKRFVDAGGYAKKEYWDPKIDPAVFRDATGRPGPATWQGGSFEPGKEQYPVNGISWYEANAYARFSGKMLPTIHHWRRAAFLSAGSWIVPQSNIDGTALAKVGAFKGMSPFGVIDMAGNVREWCANSDGQRVYALGGGYSEPPYMFEHSVTIDPMDRFALNGVRLMRPLATGPDAEASLAMLSRPAPHGFRDYNKERPADEATFRGFLPIFEYDHTPLNARIEKVDSSDSRWVRQTVTFDAAYGPERMTAYVFLPRSAKPPYQTVLYYPGAAVLDLRDSKGALNGLWDFIAPNGRAVMYPIYQDTYERGGRESVPMGTDPVYNMSGGLLGPNTYRDRVVMDVKDVRRSLDYLATRSDIDTAKIAYVGHSWGARLAAINLAVEKRFKAAALFLPGLMMAPRRPEVDELNFLPRVRVPTLVLSGRYDDVFPLETASGPYFRMLGVPQEQKRQQVYPTQHFLPRDAMIRETLDWLDKYLGKPKQ